MESGKMRIVVLKYVATNGPSLLMDVSRTLAKTREEKKEVYKALRDLVEDGILTASVVEIVRDAPSKIRIWAKQYQISERLQKSA